MDEVVTGMMMRENKTPIGYIPAGTTNDFASSLHISKNMLEAADTIVTGTPFSFDIGQFNDDYFVLQPLVFSQTCHMRRSRV